MKHIIYLLLFITAHSHAATLKINQQTCENIITDVTEGSISKSFSDTFKTEDEYKKLIRDKIKDNIKKTCIQPEMTVKELKDAYSLACEVPCKEAKKNVDACLNRCDIAINKFNYLEIGAQAYQKMTTAPDCTGVVNTEKTKSKILELENNVLDVRRSISK